MAGSWKNGGQFVAGSGSSVILTGINDAEISGATTFASVSCNVPGKKITFADGASVTATTLASFSGDAEHPLTMASASGETWTFTGTGASVAFADVAIGGCQSTETLNVQGGTNLGENSANVNVINVTPKTLTWTGASDTSWSTDGNWSSTDGEPRAPLGIDTVIVPPTARQPVLVGAANCAALTVDQGATLDLTDKNLSVSGNLVVNGSLVASGAQTISVGGNVSIAGTFTRSLSTLLLNGTAAQSVSCVSPLYALVVNSSAVTFLGSLTCDSFLSETEDARTLSFAEGTQLKASTFTVKADKDGEKTVLAPVAADGHWSLSTYASDVASVTVKNCDASAGLPVIPANSTGTGCVNWFFTDTRTVWDGTTELTEGTDLVVETNVTAKIASDIALGSIELREGAKLTISASVPVTKNVLVGKNSTLVWNKPATIGGQLVVLDGAKLTHSANGTTEAYKLNLTVAGGGYVAAGGAINVDSCGHNCDKTGNLGWEGGNSAASHGGRGYPGGGAYYDGYGSIVSPTNCGSGSYFVDTACSGNTVASGGGAIRLAFGGNLVIDGSISANGGSGTHYTPSGGSIFITAARISCTGTIRARGGSGSTNMLGGGGRISFVLTEPGADFSEITGSVDVWGGLCGAPCGSAGTIYYKTADEAKGTVVIRGSEATAEGTLWTSYDRTQLPSPSLCAADEVVGVGVCVSDHGTLSITRDIAIGSISVSGTRPRIFLNGHTLTVKKVMRPKERKVIEAVTTKGGGQIVWTKPGLLLIVR